MFPFLSIIVCLLGQELQRLPYVKMQELRPQGSLPPDTYTF